MYIESNSPLCKSFDLAKIARRNLYEKQFSAAGKAFLAAFDSNPKAWWLAMEALRCQQMLNAVSNSEISTCSENILFFSPNYTAGNSYQTNLYSECHQAKYSVTPSDTFNLETVKEKISSAKQIVFHQHWIKEFYWNAPTISEGVKAIDLRIGILKAYKAFGAKIVWTLHNLVDHDASVIQTELCIYANREMQKISDLILVHTKSAGELLSQQCDNDVSFKCQILEHSLYNDILSIPDFSIPKEINQQHLIGKRILLCLGMIRPYKGVPDLIQAFERYTSLNPNHSLHLIIAGHLSDPDVRQAMNCLQPDLQSKISLVGRKLTDDEMAGLMRAADISVTPYRKILTSGSFYLATTFGKPTLAPQKGMFEEVIRNNETGLLYDGSIEELVLSIQKIAELSDSELKAVGARVYDFYKHMTIKTVSANFFRVIEAL